jgi:hypothetical protein
LWSNELLVLRRWRVQYYLSLEQRLRVWVQGSISSVQRKQLQLLDHRHVNGRRGRGSHTQPNTQIVRLQVCGGNPRSMRRKQLQLLEYCHADRRCGRGGHTQPNRQIVWLQVLGVNTSFVKQKLNQLHTTVHV